MIKKNDLSGSSASTHKLQRSIHDPFSSLINPQPATKILSTSDSNFSLLPHADFDAVVGSHAYPIGFFSDFPSELVSRIKAAGVSFSLGIKSIDYTKKNYVDNFPEDKFSNRNLQFSNFISKQNNLISESFKKIGIFADGAGHLIAGLSLLRIASAFDAAI